MSLPLRGRAIIRGINPSARAVTRLISLETKHTHLLTYNYHNFSGLTICLYIFLLFQSTLHWKSWNSYKGDCVADAESDLSLYKLTSVSIRPTKK